LGAYDGRTGLDTVRTRRHDLVILDLNLPDIDGIKACQIIRREFDLLELFASYPDEVLSREFIQKQVWRDSQLYQTSRVMSTYNV